MPACFCTQLTMQRRVFSVVGSTTLNGGHPLDVHFLLMKNVSSAFHRPLKTILCHQGWTGSVFEQIPFREDI